MASSTLRLLTLGIWIFSLLMWLAVVMTIVTRGCDCDLFGPLVTWAPLINLVNAGAISFSMSFISMAVYVTYWLRPGEKRTDN